jgi:pyruvate/2-oxoglutarate dehydrogenase complex dihydrolipoamide dehydrogenase (E3) component
LGIDVFFGEGRFAGKDSIEAGGRSLRFKKAVIATGARAVHPKIDGMEETGYRTNETVFNLTSLPRRLVVIGGGPIGCELAQAFHRLGSIVTIVQHTRFLPREDADASALLSKVFEREGIRILLESKPVRVENSDGLKCVTVQTTNGEQVIETDEILIGAGRQPNVEGLNLEGAGIAYDERKGVQVDDFLRTTNKRVYAAGDICMDWKFTHAADAAARIAIQNALFMGRKRLSALTMPWCTYTSPEIAHVGLYEYDAKKQGLETRTFKAEMSDIDRAVAVGEEEGFIKILIEKGSDRILGATVVSAHAGEMISEISVAMAGGIGLGKLSQVIHPYPTQAEAIKRVADAYNRTRLTPFVKNIFAKYLAWQRRL